MRINRRTLVFLLLIVGLTIPFGTGPSSATTRCVNPGGTGGCFSSIQAAVNASMPGDTINVAAGTYTEQVKINKTLTLRGAQAGVDARTRAAAESIITFANGPVVIQADNVVIDGFTIQGASNSDPSTGFGAGIWTNPPASGTQGGHQILNNIIKANIIGLFLHNTGTLLTKVQFNLFDSNNLSGSSSGCGIESELGLKSALIDSNKFTNNLNAGVLLAGGPGSPGSSGVTISQNEFTLNANAMGLYSTTSSTITQNNIHDQTFSQIAIDSSSSGLRITENFIQNGGTRGIRIGNFIGTEGASSSNITVNCNSISGNPTAGLQIDASADYTGTLDAKNNWWGSATGPTIVSNPGGTGDAIIDPGTSVVYTPFLTSGTDNSPATPGFQCACVSPPANLVSWWKAEGNGNDSQDGNDGMLKNGATFGPGVVGQAFSFDGVDDRFEVPDAANLELTGDFTIDFWVNPSATQKAFADILRKEDANGNNGFGIEMNSVANSNSYFAGWKTGASPPSTSLQCWTSNPFTLIPNMFQHVAVVKSGTTRQVYINGVLVPSATCTGTNATIATNTAPLQVGAWTVNPGREWAGLVDELEIFNRALTAQEIQAIVTAGSSGKCRVCSLMCPSNIMKSNDTDKCGAVATFAPTATGSCGTVVCTPASGSLFPVGTTTVTCKSINNTGPEMCMFTVTVVDTQPPNLTCSADISAAGAASCPIATGTTPVTFTATATDNCPGTVTVVCKDQNGNVVTPGQSFPLGTTTVTCKATDVAGNMSTCTFNVTGFSFCLQDDSNAGSVVFVNAQTGDYVFCCGGVPIASGRGTLTTRGCIGSIDHFKGNRQVHIQWDTAANNSKGAGTAYVQKSGSGRIVCQITDKNMSNNTCQCGSPPPMSPTKLPKQTNF